MNEYQLLLQEYGELAKQNANLKVISIQKEIIIRDLKDQIEKLELENKGLNGGNNGTE